MSSLSISGLRYQYQTQNIRLPTATTTCHLDCLRRETKTSY